MLLARNSRARQPFYLIGIDMTIQRLRVVLADWWSDLGADGQTKYLSEHPDSEKAKEAKKAKEKKSSEDKPASTDKQSDQKPKQKPTIKKGLPFKHIQPEDRKKTVALLDKLKSMADEAKEKGEKAPDYDLCQVSIPGTNLFCGVNKGIPREKMPQLKGNAVPGSKADKLPKGKGGEVDSEKAFVEALKEKGIRLVPKKVDASRLKSTQSQLVGTKVAGMTDALKKNPDNPGIRAPIYVSKDGYILDGHHRWAAVVGLELNENKPVMMDTVVVDLSAHELVNFTNTFCDDYGIEQKGA
jgi:ParB-like chromosome segregation protein Spo0J